MVSGADNFGNTWVTSDGPSQLNSSFTMANQAETSQAFNSADFVNGLGDWATTYSLMDSIVGLYQQVLFTAPVGKQLSKGQNFMLDVNFSGIVTTDSGWAASWDDRAAPVIPTDIPEQTTLALLGMGALGLIGAARRRKA